MLNHSFNKILSPTNAAAVPSKKITKGDPSVAFVKHCVAQPAVIGAMVFDTPHAESAHWIVAEFESIPMAIADIPLIPPKQVQQKSETIMALMRDFPMNAGIFFINSRFKT